jgi:tetratricopeptide (TPR) repeat protein
MGYACFEEKSFDSSLLYLNRFMEAAATQKQAPIARDYRYIGLAQMKTKHDSLGIISLTKAYELDPTKKEILPDLADAHYKRKEWSKAITYLDYKIADDKAKGVDVDVNDVFTKGRAYYFAKDYINADTTFGAVCALIPNKTFGWLYRAKTKMKLESDTKNPSGLAVPYYLKFIEVAGADIEKNKKDLIDAYSNLGFISFTAKDKPRAKEMYTKVLELDPTNTQAKNNIEALK